MHIHTALSILATWKRAGHKLTTETRVALDKAQNARKTRSDKGKRKVRAVVLKITQREWNGCLEDDARRDVQAVELASKLRKVGNGYRVSMID